MDNRAIPGGQEHLRQRGKLFRHKAGPFAGIAKILVISAETVSFLYLSWKVPFFSTLRRGSPKAVALDYRLRPALRGHAETPHAEKSLLCPDSLHMIPINRKDCNYARCSANG